MSYWLIRHPNLSFERPVMESELVLLIESGKLGPKDEICKAGEYWFPLQDAQEVRKFLKEVKLEAILPKMTERTSTSLITDTRGKLGEDGSKAESTSSLKVQLEPVVHEEPVAFSAPELTEEEPLDSEMGSGGSKVVFVLVLLVIFLGTLYLLWSGSR
jgi:hypothetical protein